MWKFRTIALVMLLFLIFIINNGTSNELSFEPIGEDIPDHTIQYGSTIVHYENQSIKNVSFRHGIRIKSVTNRTPDNLTISADLYQNDQIVNSEFEYVTNMKSWITSIWTPTTIVPLEQLNDSSIRYSLRCWSNVTTDSITNSTYRESNFSIRKTLYVTNIRKSNNRHDEFLTLDLIVYSDLINVDLIAISEVISDRTIAIGDLTPGIYSYSFVVNQSLFDDLFDDIGHTFAFTITGIDIRSNLSIYYQNDFKITLYPLFVKERDEDTRSPVFYHILLIALIGSVIIIFIYNRGHY